MNSQNSSSWQLSIAISNQSIKETARQIVVWALDNQALSHAITHNLETRDNKSKNCNIVQDYKLPDIGAGSFIIAFKEQPSKEELIVGTNQRYFDEPLENFFFDEKLDSNYWYYLSNQWTTDKSFLSLQNLIEIGRAHV